MPPNPFPPKERKVLPKKRHAMPLAEAAKTKRYMGRRKGWQDIPEAKPPEKTISQRAQEMYDSSSYIKALDNPTSVPSYSTGLPGLNTAVHIHLNSEPPSMTANYSRVAKIRNKTKRS